MTKYFVDETGVYLGGFDGSEPPVDSVEVSKPPNHGLDIWDGSTWLPHTPASQPDPDADIQADITASTDFVSLKAALMGQGPRGAKVRGRK